MRPRNVKCRPPLFFFEIKLKEFIENSKRIQVSFQDHFYFQRSTMKAQYGTVQTTNNKSEVKNLVSREL